MNQTVKGDFRLDQNHAARRFLEIEPWLRKRAFRYLNHSTDVEDVLQNTFLQVWTKCMALRDERCFSAWVRRILDNESMTFLRKQARRCEVLTDSPFDQASGSLTEDDVLEGLYIHELLSAVKPKFSEALRLFYLEGYKVQEIARLTSRPDGTVKNLLHTARQRARAVA